MPRCLLRGPIALLALALVPAIALAGPPAAPVFEVTLDKQLAQQPLSGRLHVVLSTASRTRPPLHLNWFNPEPSFAIDIKDWKADETQVVDEKALHHAIELGKLPAGTYHAMAVLDLGQGGHSFAAAEGNLFCKTVAFTHDPAKPGRIKLQLNQVYAEPPFKGNERVKLVEIESKLLSDFHKKPMKLRAGVVLPVSYSGKGEKNYPTLYEIPGFGGNHHGALNAAARTNADGVELIYVVLDPDCKLGHHVFADSDNNGPYGKALVEELIPHIEKTFRAIPKASARFLTGHSSGGWSSLWLQVTYPDFFGGVWSTAPDSVDFRDFQMVNIYKDENIFKDAEGKPRPLARFAGKVRAYYQPFSDMEVVMGRGGQLQSFEAVFSPRGGDGQPKPLWDRKTGKIDHETAKTWERYDIRMTLEKNWQTLAPKLAGKIHVYMGTDDNFYLDGATLLLKQSLGQLKSDAVVEFFPGRDHMNLLDGELRRRINSEIATTFRKNNP